MSKRKLEKEEIDLTKKNVNKHISDIKKIKENLAYNLDLIEKQKYLRNFDNKWREFLQRQKDEEDNRIIKLMQDEIVEKENIVKVSEEQIRNGVEEKKPVGV